MDQDSLVESATWLVQLLESKEVVVRGALWVQLHEIKSWRFWIVSAPQTDKKEFYRVVASVMPEVEERFPEFTIADIELKLDSDPVIKAMDTLFRFEGFNSAYISRNMINGVYTPDGIMIRLAL